MASYAEIFNQLPGNTSDPNMSPAERRRQDTINRVERDAAPYRGWYDFFTGGRGDELVNERANQLAVREEQNRAAYDAAGAAQTGEIEVTDQWGAPMVIPIVNAPRIEDPNYAANRQRLQQGANNIGSRPNYSMTGARVDTAPQDEVRTRQMALADQLQRQATGTAGPSAAELQLQRSTDRNMNDALSLALTAKGGNQMAALKQAQDKRAIISQEAGADAAALRAQEQQTAQQALAQQLATTRGTDVGLATTQAGLTQQTGQTNLTAAVQQQQQRDELIKFYTQAGLSLDQANLAAQIQQRQFGAELASRQIMAANGIQMGANQGQMQLVGAGIGAAGTFGASMVDMFGGKK